MVRAFVAAAAILCSFSVTAEDKPNRVERTVEHRGVDTATEGVDLQDHRGCACRRCFVQHPLYVGRQSEVDGAFDRRRH